MVSKETTTKEVNHLTGIVIFDGNVDELNQWVSRFELYFKAYQFKLGSEVTTINLSVYMNKEFFPVSESWEVGNKSLINPISGEYDDEEAPLINSDISTIKSKISHAQIGDVLWNAKDAKRFKKFNDILLREIRQHVSDNPFNKIAACTRATEAWEIIQTSYSVIEESALWNLLDVIQAPLKPNEDATTYITFKEDARRKLEQMKLFTVSDRVFANLLLRGIPDEGEYTTIKTTLVHARNTEKMGPLTTVETIAAIRSVHSNMENRKIQSANAVANVAGTPNANPRKGYECLLCKKAGRPWKNHSQSRCYRVVNCPVCDKTGHGKSFHTYANNSQSSKTDSSNPTTTPNPKNGSTSAGESGNFVDIDNLLNVYFNKQSASAGFST